MTEPLIDLITLTDGGQQGSSIADRLVAYLDGAQRTLELALYDLKLSPALADPVIAAITRAGERGVAVRIAHNIDFDKPAPIPPPPRGDPKLIDRIPVPTRGIPGIPDLMHHKYVVRDGEAVWSGSTNWTDDSWTREENVIAIVSSAALARAYQADFGQLWDRGKVAGSGDVDPDPVPVGDATVRAWFCPDRGTALAHRIAEVLDRATRRIRIASPVLTSGPILGTVAEIASHGTVDLAGVVDATQVRQVVRQWTENEHAAWKLESLRDVMRRAPFGGKRSTPYAPDSVHDYMHAKITVADDIAFVGSFNLSRSGEMNAENVMEIRDAAIADRLAAYIDTVRARYPDRVDI